MKEFQIHFDKNGFEDLRVRIRHTHFPEFRQADGWLLGTPADFLREVLSAWSVYDWSAQQQYLNSFRQYICNIDGVDIHFFHIKSGNPAAVPILMAHGWPDCFLRYTKTFPLLKDFDIVVPAIPGFGFASLPAAGYVDNAVTARLWHKLMRDVLGYEHYVATGGDMGRGVLFYMAANYPGEITGLHLTDVGFVKSIVAAPDDTLAPDYLSYKHAAHEWMRRDGAYINIQGTRPYSLGYGLCDSPAGLAAWFTEKYHDWSDWERFAMSDLLNVLTIYWFTGCGASSITAYHGNSFTLPPLGEIRVPVGIAQFPHDILPAPERWIKQNYNVVRYTRMPYGGHFTAMEAPEPFADDLRAFVAELKG